MASYPETYNDPNKLREIACEQALLFGRVKRVSRERTSERRSRVGRSREAHFAYPNRKACSQAIRETSKLLLKTFKEGMNNSASTKGGRTAGQI